MVGAGAAGLFCAGLLAQRGLHVVLVEHEAAPGRKILISGGGRANFTNLNTRPEHFLSENPHFAKSALARYTPAQFVGLVERYGIAYHAKTPGQLFCDGSARQIVDMLLAECHGAELRLNTRVLATERLESGFDLRLGGPSGESRFSTRALIVATGGLSIPKLGASDFGYALAARFGLAVVPQRPALVPLCYSAEKANPFAGLSGVSAEAALAIAGGVAPRRRRPPAPAEVRFHDKLLITHRGISGPAVLQISSYWKPGTTLFADLLPGRNPLASLLREAIPRSRETVLAALAATLPRRLAERVLERAPPTGWTNEALLAAEKLWHAWPLTPDGTEGFAKAEVTAGGISTAELHAQTMEARKVPGLYFIGEVVDVTGHLGGFNFQWAWASAAAAAQAIAAQQAS